MQYKWVYEFMIISLPTHPYNMMKDWKCNHDLLIITFSDQL